MSNAERCDCFLPLTPTAPAQRQSLERLYREVEKYRGDPVVAGWSTIEEMPMDYVELFEAPLRKVEEIDPGQTLPQIFNRLTVLWDAAQKYPMTVAYRDFYPYFGWHKAGPVGAEACANALDVEMRLLGAMLPRGASAWAMPQSIEMQAEEEGAMRMIYRRPSGAELKLQAWISLGAGCRGVTYFHYASDLGDAPEFTGLRMPDGSSSPAWIELGTLARRLVPRGSVIAGWEQSYLPLQTDRYQLRAYLFRNRHDPEVNYVVAFNRDATRRTQGRVRLPFTGVQVTDLLDGGRVGARSGRNHTTIRVDYPAGDGTIYRLVGAIPDESPGVDGNRG